MSAWIEIRDLAGTTGPEAAPAAGAYEEISGNVIDAVDLMFPDFTATGEVKLQFYAEVDEQRFPIGGPWTIPDGEAAGSRYLSVNDSEHLTFKLAVVVLAGTVTTGTLHARPIIGR